MKWILFVTLLAVIGAIFLIIKGAADEDPAEGTVIKYPEEDEMFMENDEFNETK
jgi:hypothetical protein